MASRAITIQVDPEAAQAYEKASAEEKRKLDVLLSLKLTEVTKAERPLEDVMRDISRNAQARGLTPEVLKTLLDEYRPTEEPFGTDEPDFEESPNEEADGAEDPKSEDDRN